jgi:hypothetical protein
VDDQVDSALFAEAEADAAAEVVEFKLTGEAADLARLPLELKFRIAQMEYNSLHHSSIAPHLALRDWFKVALPILYGEWDSQKFEKGGHRKSDDGYRREVYLMIIEKCLKCAGKFNHFRQLDCVNSSEENGSTAPSSTSAKKKRRICSTVSEPSAGSLGSDLIALSQVSFRLRAAKKAEEKTSRAAPPRLSFGSSIVR